MEHSFSDRIKRKAQELGFQKVGIARAEPIPEAKTRLEYWLKEGKHATMSWMEKRKDERTNIFTYFPEAKSIISVGMNYFTGISKKIFHKENTPLKISNYAWGEDYHKILKSRLLKLLKWIKSHVPGVKSVVGVDTSPIMEKIWAQNAGLGWQGKNTNLITRDFGSWLFLGELILNIELDYDEKFANNLCGTCTACIDACPTKALTEYELDARKCISYLTIEHRNDLPREYRNKLHGWIYGCDVCQEVCPWNKKFAQLSKEPAFAPRPELISKSAFEWMRLRENEYRRILKNSSMRRTKFNELMRNVSENVTK